MSSGAEEFGAWSTSGCREVERDGNRRVCECTQLAHFGMLFVSVTINNCSYRQHDIKMSPFTSGSESKASHW